MPLTPDIVIRQPTWADAPAIEAMFARCSPESRYARFLAPLVAVPPEHLSGILGSCAKNAAWVGVMSDRPDTVLALGSWSRDGSEAELALIVEDSWQRRGIGSKLLRTIADGAWNAGVCRLTASVLTESKHVFRMLRAVLGPTSARADGYVSHVTSDRCDDPEFAPTR